MTTPIELFTRHPASVGESYGEHFLAASRFGTWMLAGALACLVHAVFPFLFVKAGSGIVRRLHEAMVVNRHRRAGEPDTAPAVRHSAT